MRRVLTLVATLVVCAALATPAQAQFARAGIEGTVTDPDGQPLPGVTVTTVNEANGQTRTSVTGLDGGYNINGITPGTVTLSFALSGFNTSEQTGVKLLVGQKPSVDVSMTLSGVAETVTVTGQAPMIETASKQVGGNVQAEDFTTLPTQGRSFVMFAALLPGVIGSPSTESTASDSLFINGQDDNNNSFNIDGADNSDDVIGARAGAQTRTAIEAIQEFQIITTQFDAEFGRTSGGVLNAITKSGGNRISGSGFYFLQDSSLNNKNFFTERNNQAQPDFKNTSVGGTLGAPIIKDKLFFFGSYELTKPNDGVARNFENRPELNFSTSEDNKLDNKLFKLDWQASQNTKLAARYTREYSPQVNQIIGGTTTLEAAREEDDTDTAFVGTIDTVVGERGFNNLRISNTREDVSFANPGYNNNGQTFAAQRALAVMQNRPGVREGANTVAQSRINDSAQVDDTFSYYTGNHDMRAGLQWSRRREEFFNSGRANGRFTFDTDRVFNAADPSTFPTSFGVRINGETTAEIPSNKVFGAFLQDNWRPTENLTVNLGLRYDRETILPGDNNNFSPRLGFSWDPNGDGQTVVRGGFGRFYERLQLGSFANYFLDAATGTGGFLTSVPGSGSDQALFQAIAAANGITTIQGLADYVIADLESGTGAPVNTGPTVQNFDISASHADTLTIGAEHSLNRDIAVGVDYIHTANRNLLVFASLNPFSRSQGGRPNISILNGGPQNFNNIGTWFNPEGAESTYNGLQMSLRRRFTDSAIGRVQFRLSYTYGTQSGTAGAGALGTTFQTRTESGFNFDTNSIIGAPVQLNLDDPRNQGQPSSWHRSNNLVFNWAWYVPGTGGGRSAGLLFSGLFRHMDGSRFTPILFSRLDNNGRIPAPAGSYGANATSDIAQSAVTTDGGLNDAVRPNFTRLDLTLRYKVPIKSFSVTAIFDMFNITGRTNFNHRTSFVESSSFLIPSSANSPRQFQLGIRADW